MEGGTVDEKAWTDSDLADQLFVAREEMLKSCIGNDPENSYERGTLRVDRVKRKKIQKVLNIDKERKNQLLEYIGLLRPHHKDESKVQQSSCNANEQPNRKKKKTEKAETNDDAIFAKLAKLEEEEEEANAKEAADDVGAEQRLQLRKQRSWLKQERNLMKYEQSKSRFLTLSPWFDGGGSNNEGGESTSVQVNNADGIGGEIPLPTELLYMILGYLSIRDICRCSQVSMWWKVHFRTEQVWRDLFNRYYGKPSEDEIFAAWRRNSLSWRHVCKARFVKNMRAERRVRQLASVSEKVLCSSCNQVTAEECFYQRNLDVVVVRMCGSCGCQNVHASSFDKCMWFHREG